MESDKKFFSKFENELRMKKSMNPTTVWSMLTAKLDFSGELEQFHASHFSSSIPTAIETEGIFIKFRRNTSLYKRT